MLLPGAGTGVRPPPGLDLEPGNFGNYSTMHTSRPTPAKTIPTAQSASSTPFFCSLHPCYPFASAAHHLLYCISLMMVMMLEAILLSGVGGGTAMQASTAAIRTWGDHHTATTPVSSSWPHHKPYGQQDHLHSIHEHVLYTGRDEANTVSGSLDCAQVICRRG